MHISILLGKDETYFWPNAWHTVLEILEPIYVLEDNNLLLKID